MKLLLPIIILVICLMLGGWKSIRNQFSREAVREVSRIIYHR